MRYALVGCGKVAEKHLKAALAHKGRLEIVALVDRDPKAPARLLDRCKVNHSVRSRITLFEDHAEMLLAAKPEIVAITTPSGTHAAIGIDAISAGAHVLVEKPLTLDLADADRLLDVARGSDRRIAVGHMYRFFPMVDLLKADLDAGRFGRVLFGDVKVRWGHGQDYYDQGAWRGTWAADGGALMNQSIHAFDLMTWLMGRSPRAVEEVSGTIARMDRVMEAEDYGAAVLRFHDGAICMLEGTTLTDPHRKEASFFLQCTGGSIRAGLYKGIPRVEIRDASGKSLLGGYLRRWLALSLRTPSGRMSLRNLKNAHTALYGDFLDSVRDGRSPRADGASGRDALELVLAIYRSASTRGTVAMPLEEGSTREMKGFFER
jgi:predicted dehydrogenase